MYDVSDITCATSVVGALEALAANPDAQVIAGGTDVLVALRAQAGVADSARLVSIHGLSDELGAIELGNDATLRIGALATFRDIVESDVVRTCLPVLGEACDTVGGPQIRAMGTIGGNVCNGMTTADSASALMAAGASMVVVGLGEAPAAGFDSGAARTSDTGVTVAVPPAVAPGATYERRVPIEEWYTGPGSVALAPGELLVRIEIPRAGWEGWGGCYLKYAARNALDVDLVGCCCLVRLSDDREHVADVRLAVGAFGPGPIRMREAEDAVCGRAVDEAAARVGEVACTLGSPRTDLRATEHFRRRVLKEMASRALAEAARRAGAKGPAPSGEMPAYAGGMRL